MLLGKFSICFGTMVLSASCFAGGVSQGGGDVYAREFVSQALSVADLLSSNPTVKNYVDPIALREEIDKKVIVTSKDHLFLDWAEKEEVDAINYPTENRIEISRSRWDQIKGMPVRRAALELHEYLGIMQIAGEHNHYDVSVAIGKLLGIDFQDAFIPLPGPQTPPTGIPAGYVQWANGGGWVSPSAVIAPSVFVDAKSIIGSGTVVKDGAIILASNLSADCGKATPGQIAPGMVGENVMIVRSDFKNNWKVDSKAQISDSHFASGCAANISVDSGATVASSTLNGAVSIEERANVVSSLLVRSSVEDNATVRNSQLTDSYVEDYGMIENSHLSEGSYVENGSVVKDSFLRATTFSDNAVVVSSSLTHVTGGDRVFVRAATLSNHRLNDGTIVDNLKPTN